MICVSDSVFCVCYGFLSSGVTGQRAQLIIHNHTPLFNCQCQTPSFSSESVPGPFFLTRLQVTCTGLGTRLVHEHLPYKTGLHVDVTQSHPLRRTRFSQYQASSAVLGWPGDGDCYLMRRMQSGGWPYSKVGRDSSKAPCTQCVALIKTQDVRNAWNPWKPQGTLLGLLCWLVGK